MEPKDLRTETLALALCLAQIELKNPDRNKSGFGYKYADLASIIEATKPVLEKNGLSIIQFPISKDGWIGVKTTVQHTSGESMSEDFFLPMIEMKGMNSAQAAGALITYARRYALSAVLNIAADEDTDASGDSKDKRPYTKKTEPNPVQSPHAGVEKMKENYQKAQEPTGEEGFNQMVLGQDPNICPKCGVGHLVERTAKATGKKFTGCDTYPACDYAKWGS